MNRTDKYSQHSKIIWPAWLNGSVFVYELSGFGFDSRCCYQISAYTDKFIFANKFVKKGASCGKQKKINMTIEFCIFELVLVPNFSINLVSVKNFALNKQFWSKTKKKETSSLNSAYLN